MAIRRSKLIDKLEEDLMATVNIFKADQVSNFLSSPQLWKCNCGKPVYFDKAVLGSRLGFSTIICQCGHELTQLEYDSFTDEYHAAISADLSLSDLDVRLGKKNDEAKLRIDLLLDMPRALKAIADLMQKALVDYEEGSWLDVPDAVKRYRAAHLRHTIERAINPIDPQFGLDHDVAIALNSMFVLELRLREEENE